MFQNQNYLIKFSTTNININSYIDSILTNLKTLEPTSYDYNRRLYSHLNRTTKLLSSNYKTILFNKLKKNCKFFNDIPILYIAAGPSLDENMDWIKQNQNKFFIVTIGAAYKKLLANNIRIDMITTLDEKEELNTLQFDDESVSKLSKQTIILASTITYYKILEKLSTKNLYLFEVFRWIDLDSISELWLKWRPVTPFLEEKIDEIIEDKIKLSGDVLSLDSEKWITEYSNEELMNMFALDGEL